MHILCWHSSQPLYLGGHRSYSQPRLRAHHVHVVRSLKSEPFFEGDDR